MHWKKYRKLPKYVKNHLWILVRVGIFGQFLWEKLESTEFATVYDSGYVITLLLYFVFNAVYYTFFLKNLLIKRTMHSQLWRNMFYYAVICYKYLAPLHAPYRSPLSNLYQIDPIWINIQRRICLIIITR